MLSQRVVDTIASGTEVRRAEVVGGTRLVLEHAGNDAVLVRQRGSNSWVLTAFDRMPGTEAGGATRSSATHDAPIRSRDAMGAGKQPSGETRAGFDASSSTHQAPTPTRRMTGADGKPIIEDDAAPSLDEAAHEAAPARATICRSRRRRRRKRATTRRATSTFTAWISASRIRAAQSAPAPARMARRGATR